MARILLIIARNTAVKSGKYCGMIDKLAFGNFKLGVAIYGSLWFAAWGTLFYMYHTLL